MKKYFELKISINPNLEEIVADIFFTNFDCEGIVLEEETYKDLEMTATTRGILRVFLSSFPDNLNDILKMERTLLKSRGLTNEELGSWEIILDEKENQDWSKKWKEKWTVTHVSEKISIVPSWIEYTPTKGEITISLDPGCAFGTGTHQTTQLCMYALEKYLKSGDNVADIGTGSGILSILAKKLGANYVYGCDNDETVISVAKENAKKNNVCCEFELNTADKLLKKYDFVCANILHFVLAEIMGDLKNLLTPNGLISLSGILDEKKDVVLEAIKRENLKIVETFKKNQWISYVVQKADIGMEIL